MGNDTRKQKHPMTWVGGPLPRNLGDGKSSAAPRWPRPGTQVATPWLWVPHSLRQILPIPKAQLYPQDVLWAP